MLTQVVFPSRIPAGKVLMATPVCRADRQIQPYHRCRIFNEANRLSDGPSGLYVSIASEAYGDLISIYDGGHFPLATVEL